MMPNIPTFIELFKSDSTKHVRNLAIFIYKAVLYIVNFLFSDTKYRYVFIKKVTYFSHIYVTTLYGYIYNLMSTYDVCL